MTTQLSTLYIDYPAFTRDYLIRFNDGTSTRLLGLSSCAKILGDKTRRVLDKVLSSSSHSVVVRPFHGVSFTFIYR